jgi:hypothetical protein
MLKIQDTTLMDKIEEFLNIHGHTLSEGYETKIIEDMQPNIVIKPSSYMPSFYNKNDYSRQVPLLQSFPRVQRKGIPELHIVIGKRMSYGYLVTGSLMIGGGWVKAVPTESLMNMFPKLRQR